MLPHLMGSRQRGQLDWKWQVLGVTGNRFLGPERMRQTLVGFGEMSFPIPGAW